MSHEYEPGTYAVRTNRLHIRATPTTVNNNNVLPESLTAGKEVTVYRIVPDLRNNGWVWGVITPPGLGNERYICITNLNTKFAVPVESHGDATAIPPELVVWVTQVHQFLVDKGFTGKLPF